MKFDESNSIPLEDFFLAYRLCRKRKRRTINAAEFEANYEENLVKLWKDVNSRHYEIGSSICFMVHRPKDREVFAADFRDRIVHHIIMMRLEPLFECDFIYDSYSCRVGKGTLFGVMRLADIMKEQTNNFTEEAWVGKFDLKGFFMSIDKSILLSKLKEYVNKKYIEKDREVLLYLIEKVIMDRPQDHCIRKSAIGEWKALDPSKSLFTCGDGLGLPIGNLTSQCFANFYLNEFDWMMTKLFDGCYGRYVDDFYVVSKDKEKITKRVGMIRDWLWDNLRVRLHPKKVSIQQAYKGMKFIGSVAMPHRLYISNTTMTNAHDTIMEFNKAVGFDYAERFMQTMNSYFGFMRHCSSYNMKKKLLSWIDDEWFNYVMLDEEGVWRVLKENTTVRDIKLMAKSARTKNSRKGFCDYWFNFETPSKIAVAVSDR